MLAQSDSRVTGVAQTFIRVVEVWTPSDDGDLLELADGIFDSATGYEAMSRMICFSAHEGLPGHVWANGHPMLLREFEGSPFRRTAALHAAGLRCAVTMPVVRDGRITSIVQLLFADPQPHDALVELWRNDAAPHCVDSFPARAARLEPVVDSGAAVRAALHVAKGPSPGEDLQTLSLSFEADGQLAWSLRFSAPPGLPLARRTEIWSRRGADDPQRVAGWCEETGALSTGDATATSIDALGPIGVAMTTGVAQVVSGREPAGRGRASAAAARSPAQIAIPFGAGTAATDVVALHF